MYSEEEVKQTIRMIEDKTAGIVPAHVRLPERLQRLLDLPCEICDDGRKLERWKTLTRNLIRQAEYWMCQSIMGTDLEEEIGITQEEYDELDL